jgi:hypothetical protein
MMESGIPLRINRALFGAPWAVAFAIKATCGKSIAKGDELGKFCRPEVAPPGNNLLPEIVYTCVRLPTIAAEPPSKMTRFLLLRLPQRIVGR